MKASQPKIATTVPAALAAILFMVLGFSFAKLIRLSHVDFVVSRYYLARAFEFPKGF